MELYTRTLFKTILKDLKTMPAIFLNGPRQTGKSTLAIQIQKHWFDGSATQTYLTFDDPTIYASASADPTGFVAQLPPRVIIDEVQMVPEIFRALKKRIDDTRRTAKHPNGQFLLTGSTNIMALPQLADALVSRMGIITLLPISSSEYFKTHSRFIDTLFNQTIPLRQETFETKPITQLIKKTTFPELSINPKIDATKWFSNYITTLIQRDIKQIAQIEKATEIPRLLQMLAARTGSTLNDSDLSNATGLNIMTLRRYRSLIEQIFLVFQVRPFFRNIEKRLVKTPKVYFTDTYLLTYLLGIDLDSLLQNQQSLFGHILENFVATELKKQLSLYPNIELYHFRTQDQKEVDFVLERQDGKLVGIEVKAAKSISKTDFNGLKILSEQTSSDFICGIILYQGNDILPFGKNLWAMPINALWSLG